jgi:hypothetical protein
VSNIPGTFEFVTPSDIPVVGTPTIGARFIPDDLINYEILLFDLEITVNKASINMTGVIIETVRVFYTGENHTIDLSHIVLPAGVEIDYIQYGNRRDIGTHSFTVVFKVADSNNFITPDSMTVTLVILPAEEGPNWLLIGVAGGAGALMLIATISFVIRANRLKKAKEGNVNININVSK